MVFRAWFAQHRVLVIFAPVEGAGIDDDAAQRIAMAAEKLSQRMHDDVGSMNDRPDQVWRRQGVVHDQRHAGFAGTAEIASISVMLPAGFAMDSTNIAFVCGVTARSKLPMSSGSAHTTFHPKLLEACVNWLIDPP